MDTKDSTSATYRYVFFLYFNNYLHYTFELCSTRLRARMFISSESRSGQPKYVETTWKPRGTTRKPCGNIVEPHGNHTEPHGNHMEIIWKPRGTTWKAWWVRSRSEVHPTVHLFGSKISEPKRGTLPCTSVRLQNLGAEARYIPLYLRSGLRITRCTHRTTQANIALRKFVPGSILTRGSCGTFRPLGCLDRTGRNLQKSYWSSSTGR